MSSPFDAFPIYLTVRDVMDATQYGKSTVYVMIHEAEKQKDIVFRRGTRGIRLHRDNFFKWYMSRERMELPDDLKEAK